MPGASETLASFLPRIALDALRGEPAPAAPDALEIVGALLFADIHDFTGLTLDMARRGNAGPELIVELLNACFDRIIVEVTSHGGDVLEFDGDAVIALWRAAEGDQALADATATAERCARAIQVAVQQASVNLRIGLAAGPMFLTRVGGSQGRWIFLVSGAPFEEVGRVSRTTRPGDVACLDRTRSLVKRGRPALRREGPHHAPVPPDAQLIPYLPDILVRRVAAGRFAWISELRTVSIVFLILRELDGARPDDRTKIQSATVSVQQALDVWDGVLNQMLLDDTGHVLLAAFGLPSMSHEDDPTRATLAALAIERALSDQRLSFSIGVTTGWAYCGAYGNERRRRYAIVGDTVNLAARLAQHARQGLLTDATTATEANSRIAFEARPPMTLKGRREPTPVFAPQRTDW